MHAARVERGPSFLGVTHFFTPNSGEYPEITFGRSSIPRVCQPIQRVRPAISQLPTADSRGVGTQSFRRNFTKSAMLGLLPERT